MGHWFDGGRQFFRLKPPKMKLQPERTAGGGTHRKFTASGLIFATIYDTWTNFGVFWLSYTHTPENLLLVYVLGLPFMLYHLLSSIMTFTVLGFPIYCALSSMANDTQILNQRKELEI